MSDQNIIPEGMDPLEYFLIEEKRLNDKFAELDKEGAEIRKSTNEAFAAVDKALEDVRVEIEKDSVDEE